MKMGIYAYGLSARTKKHLLFGEVGVLRFLHKPAPLFAEEKWVKEDEKREAYYRGVWKGRTIPKFVVYEKDGDFSSLSFYRGGAVWFDCDENLCIPFHSQKGLEMLAAFFTEKAEEQKKIAAALFSAPSVV
jgi:hypothetical protein